MAEVTLGFDELETNDLPPICVQCGARRDVEFTPRTFMRRSLIPAYGLLFAVLSMSRTRRVTVEVPLCPEHGGPRLFAHQRTAWWGLRTVAIEADRLTIGGASEYFAEALYHWREKRRRGEIPEPPLPPRRRIQVGRGTGGGGAALKVMGILVAVMAGLLALGAVAMFGLMALGILFLPKAAPPAAPPPPPALVAGPAANVEPRPEGVVVGLLAAAPPAGCPAALPWAALALAARKTTFHLLEDAELDKALADLKSPDPGAVEEAANRLAAAAPDPARRAETAAALAAAAANSFPTAREAAAAGLAVWGTADDVPALARMLADPFPDVKTAAIAALAGLKDPKAHALVVPELEKAAHDRNPNVARAAADALKAVRDRQDLEEKRP